MKRFLIHASILIGAVAYAAAAPIVGYVQLNPPHGKQGGGFNVGKSTVTALCFDDASCQSTAGGSGVSILTSSGIAFGSASNTVTSDTGTFVYSSSTKEVIVGTDTIWNASMTSGDGLNSGIRAYSDGASVPYAAFAPQGTSSYRPFSSYIGNGPSNPSVTFYHYADGQFLFQSYYPTLTPRVTFKALGYSSGYRSSQLDVRVDSITVTTPKFVANYGIEAGSITVNGTLIAGKINTPLIVNQPINGANTTDLKFTNNGSSSGTISQYWYGNSLPNTFSSPLVITEQDAFNPAAFNQAWIDAYHGFQVVAGTNSPNSFSAGNALGSPELAVSTNGYVSIAHSIRWPDGTVQVSSPTVGVGGIVGGVVVPSTFTWGLVNLSTVTISSETVTKSTIQTLTSLKPIQQGDVNGNTAVGITALPYASGAWNTAFGQAALFSNTSGDENTAIGNFALHSKTGGGRNTAVGSGSLYNQTSVRDGNTAVGSHALYSSTNAYENTALGERSGYTPQTSSYSTFIGYAADSSVNGITNSTALGNGAQVTASNQVVIGNGSVTQTVLNGAVTVSTITASSATVTSLSINGNVTVSSGVLLSGSAGTSGQVLTSGGAGTIPTWTTASGSGDMVLSSTQTVTGAKTFTSSTTFAGVVAMNSNKITGLANGTAATDAAAFGQVPVITPGQIAGTPTNDNAAAGNVGEAPRALATSVNAGASGVLTNLTSITLTSGDWDVTGIADLVMGTVSGGNCVFTLSVNSGTSLADAVTGDNYFNFASPAVSAWGVFSIPNWRVSVPTGTTQIIYMKGSATYGGTTPIWSGRISARRPR